MKDRTKFCLGLFLVENTIGLFVASLFMGLGQWGNALVTILGVFWSALLSSLMMWGMLTIVERALK